MFVDRGALVGVVRSMVRSKPSQAGPVRGQRFKEAPRTMSGHTRSSADLQHTLDRGVGDRKGEW